MNFLKSSKFHRISELVVEEDKAAFLELSLTSFLAKSPRSFKFSSYQMR